MRPTNKQPLFVITGASCAWKSTTCEVLFKKETNYIVMESDLLWNDIYNTPEDNYFTYRRLWMSVCANISQIGKPVVLCGCATPEQFENSPERELFSDIYYIAIVCNKMEFTRRLTIGRGVTDGNYIKSSLDFNNWLIQNAELTDPTITLIETSDISPEEAAKKVDELIMERINTYES